MCRGGNASYSTACDEPSEAAENARMTIALQQPGVANKLIRICSNSAII